MKLVARQVVKCEAIARWKMMGRIKKGKGWTGMQRGRRGNIVRQEQRRKQRRKEQCRHNQQKVKSQVASSKTRQQGKHHPRIREEPRMERQQGERNNLQSRPVRKATHDRAEAVWACPWKCANRGKAQFATEASVERQPATEEYTRKCANRGKGTICNQGQSSWTHS